MSASEIISSHLSASSDEEATLKLYPLRFRNRSSLRVWTANTLRGAFGSALKKRDADAYARFFTPSARSLPAFAAHNISPSGFRDLPRPFVFRLRETEIGVNVFLGSAVDLVRDVMEDLQFEAIGQSIFLQLSIDPPSPHLPPAQREPRSAPRLRVRFLTPTELKGASEPEFGVLMARIRDRISTLRTVYGPGPLKFDFRAFGERANRVRMTRCELQTVTEERLSKGTGQRHSIGGFIGVAEYEGAVAEFLPYLEAARWTGVGRQTVWGKGEIATEIIA